MIVVGSYIVLSALFWHVTWLCLNLFMLLGWCSPVPWFCMIVFDPLFYGCIWLLLALFLLLALVRHVIWLCLAHLLCVCCASHTVSLWLRFCYVLCFMRLGCLPVYCFDIFWHVIWLCVWPLVYWVVLLVLCAVICWCLALFFRCYMIVVAWLLCLAVCVWNVIWLCVARVLRVCLALFFLCCSMIVVGLCVYAVLGLRLARLLWLLPVSCDAIWLWLAICLCLFLTCVCDFVWLCLACVYDVSLLVVGPFIVVWPLIYDCACTCWCVRFVISVGFNDCVWQVPMILYDCGWHFLLCLPFFWYVIWFGFALVFVLQYYVMFSLSICCIWLWFALFLLLAFSDMYMCDVPCLLYVFVWQMLFDLYASL